ncbi:hypothetical protein SELMODRAFT_21427, partial [Selaginella moellendorffii]
VLDLYAKCGSMAIARKVFERMAFQDPVSWNSMIMGYVQNGDSDVALELFSRMQDEEKTLVSWNSILTGYALNGEGSETIKLFEAMKDEPLEPSARTYVALLGACSSLAAREEGKRQQGRIVKVAALAKGRAFHEMIRERELGDNVFVANALVDMYSKCGSLEEAREVFDGCRKRDVAIWNAMISACAQLGDPRMALDLFAQMEQQEGERPNEISVLGLLVACVHLGMLDEARKVVAGMRDDYGVDPRTGHLSAVVGVLARCGDTAQAQVFLESLPLGGDFATWGALLSACSTHGDAGNGREAAKRMLVDPGRGKKPDDSSPYALLANI